MPFLFSPCEPCCEPTLPTNSDVYVSTEGIGAGFVVLVGGPSVLFGGMPAPQNNGGFWFNVHALANGGVVGAAGDIAGWRLATCIPTVTVSNSAQLSSVSCLFSGACNIFPYPAQYIDESMWPAVKTWVQGGGVLVLVADTSNDFASTHNKLLKSLGASSRFIYDSEFCGNGIADSEGCSGILQGHWLTDGTLGQELCGVWYGPSNGVVRTIAFSNPVARGGNIVGAANSCPNRDIFDACDTPVTSDTLYLHNAYSDYTLLSLVYNRPSNVQGGIWKIPSGSLGGGFREQFIEGFTQINGIYPSAQYSPRSWKLELLDAWLPVPYVFGVTANPSNTNVITATCNPFYWEGDVYKYHQLVGSWVFDEVRHVIISESP